MYGTGTGTEKNPEKVFEYFQKAADQGYAKAQYALGWMYNTGTGTAQNPEKALEYFQKSADQGHIHSRIEIQKLSESKSAIPSVIQISENSVAIQIQQPIQPIAVKRPFILNVSESSAFSSAKKQTIQIE
jgi:TPR repeat protein